MRRKGVSAACLLAILATVVLGPVSGVSAQEVRVQAVTPSSGVAEAAILKALNRPTHLDFIDSPLQDAVNYFKDLHKIEIQLDQKALDEVGIAADLPITRNLTGVTLRSALNLILRDHDLTWIIEDEVLLITTPDRAASRLATKVYDMSNVIGFDAAANQELTKAITTAIAPTTWTATGGAGSISVLKAEGLHVFVIAQTEEVHQQIQQLLKILLVTRAGAVPAKK